MNWLFPMLMIILLISSIFVEGLPVRRVDSVTKRPEATTQNINYVEPSCKKCYVKDKDGVCRLKSNCEIKTA